MHPDVPAWRRSAALLSLCLAFAAPAVAQKTCSKADAANAEAAIDRVVSWGTMHKTWKDYGHCDTGQAGELFTEALLRMIVGSWPRINELETSFTKDIPYRDWILARLSSGALPPGDLDDVHDLTQNSCPKGQKPVCDELHKAAEAGKDKLKPAPKPAAPASAPPAPGAPAGSATPGAPAPSAPPKPAS